MENHRKVKGVSLFVDCCSGAPSLHLAGTPEREDYRDLSLNKILRQGAHWFPGTP